MWKDCASHILEEQFIRCSDSIYLDLEEIGYRKYGENIIFAMNYPPWKSVILNNFHQCLLKNVSGIRFLFWEINAKGSLIRKTQHPSPLEKNPNKTKQTTLGKSVADKILAGDTSKQIICRCNILEPQKYRTFYVGKDLWTSSALPL